MPHESPKLQAVFLQDLVKDPRAWFVDLYTFLFKTKIVTKKCKKIPIDHGTLDLRHLTFSQLRFVLV
jgi:hypothetical protein